MDLMQSWVGIEEGRKECLCENVSHVLWECVVYISLRNDFIGKLPEHFREGFKSLDNFEKVIFRVLCSELDNTVDVWESREPRLYDKNKSIPQFQSQTSARELGDVVDSGRLRCQHGIEGRHCYFMCVYM